MSLEMIVIIINYICRKNKSSASVIVCKTARGLENTLKSVISCRLTPTHCDGHTIVVSFIVTLCPLSLASVFLVTHLETVQPAHILPSSLYLLPPTVSCNLNCLLPSTVCCNRYCLLPFLMQSILSPVIQSLLPFTLAHAASSPMQSSPHCLLPSKQYMYTSTLPPSLLSSIQPPLLFTLSLLSLLLPCLCCHPQSLLPPTVSNATQSLSCTVSVATHAHSHCCRQQSQLVPPAESAAIFPVSCHLKSTHTLYLLASTLYCHSLSVSGHPQSPLHTHCICWHQHCTVIHCRSPVIHSLHCTHTVFVGINTVLPFIVSLRSSTVSTAPTLSSAIHSNSPLFLVICILYCHPHCCHPLSLLTLSLLPSTLYHHLLFHVTHSCYPNYLLPSTLSTASHIISNDTCLLPSIFSLAIHTIYFHSQPCQCHKSYHTIECTISYWVLIYKVLSLPS